MKEEEYFVIVWTSEKRGGLVSMEWRRVHYRDRVCTYSHLNQKCTHRGDQCRKRPNTKRWRECRRTKSFHFEIHRIKTTRSRFPFLKDKQVVHILARASQVLEKKQINSPILLCTLSLVRFAKQLDTFGFTFRAFTFIFFVQGTNGRCYTDTLDAGL